MTKEEAKEWLMPPTTLSNGNQDDPVNKHWVAYRMAIQALERVPCEDAIDRNYLTGRMFTEADLSDAHACYESIRRIVEEMPSVTPIRPKGHWIAQPSNKEQGERDFIWWKCSVCGQVIYSETEKDRHEFHAFCGRCGADMREVAE